MCWCSGKMWRYRGNCGILWARCLKRMDVAVQFEFAGNASHAMDAKGRVIIPVSFRAQLGECFTVGLNSDFSAIMIYPLIIWQETSARLAEIPDTDIEGIEYVRLITGFSFPNSDLDAQGRLLLPAPLREIAGITKNIRFVGMIRGLEVWDENKFTEHVVGGMKNIGKRSSYVYENYFKKKTPNA